MTNTKIKSLIERMTPITISKVVGVIDLAAFDGMTAMEVSLALARLSAVHRTTDAGEDVTLHFRKGCHEDAPYARVVSRRPETAEEIRVRVERQLCDELAEARNEYSVVHRGLKDFSETGAFDGIVSRAKARVNELERQLAEVRDLANPDRLEDDDDLEFS